MDGRTRLDHDGSACFRYSMENSPESYASFQRGTREEELVQPLRFQSFGFTGTGK